MLDSMPNENPFQDPLRFERRVPECAVVIFGANGDLTKRKLMPALYRLAADIWEILAQDSGLRRETRIDRKIAGLPDSPAVHQHRVVTCFDRP